MKKSRSIQSKLISVFGTMIVCAVLLTTTVTGFYVFYTQSGELLRNYQSICDNISLQIEKKLSDVENLARLLCGDNTMQRLMYDHFRQTGYQYYKTLRDINGSLTRYMMMYDDLIDDIYVIDRENTVLSRNDYYGDTLSSDWFNDYLGQPGSIYFSRPYDFVRRVSGGMPEQSTLVSCAVRMYDLRSQPDMDRFLGYIIINIKYDELIKMLGSFSDLNYVMFDRSARRFDGMNELSKVVTDWVTDDADAYLHSGGYYYFKRALPTANWTLAVAARFSMVNIPIRDTFIFLILVTVLVAIFARLIVNTLTRSITEPLKLLTNGIRQFSVGDFSTHVDIRSGDEVEEIAGCFNDMVSEIKKQMEQNLRKETEKRKSEMRFLMAQIKPHFIYNSLNCIIYLARSGRCDEIICYTRAFTSFLQDSIRTQPQQMAPILKEVGHLENYVTLLRYRYDNAPQLVCNIDESCAEVYLPSLILLPIVENSIFHGLLPLDKTGRIDLIVRRENDKVCVRVHDNGCGMPPKTVEAMQRRLLLKNEGLAQDEHIGLSNINERLKLCNCIDGIIHLESTEGSGTTVWFYLREDAYHAAVSPDTSEVPSTKEGGIS